MYIYKYIYIYIYNHRVPRTIRLHRARYLKAKKIKKFESKITLNQYMHLQMIKEQ